MPKDKHTAQIALLVAKAWTDPKFNAALKKNANKVMKSLGLPLEKGVKYRVVQNTPKVHYLVLPQRPTTSKLSFEATAQTILSSWAPPMCYSSTDDGHKFITKNVVRTPGMTLCESDGGTTPPRKKKRR